MIIAISQARTTSTRLPNKVLKAINGKSLLEIHLERIKQSKKIDRLIVATTVNHADEPIVEICNKLGYTFSRGSESDVLDRFYQAVRQIIPQYIVRLTSDCPLIDANLIDNVIGFCIDNNLDYCSNTLIQNFPDGQDVEVFRFSALERAWKEAKQASEREHVTPYIWKNSSFNGGDIFKSAAYTEENNDFGHLRMTVDEQKDFDVIKILVDKLGTNKSWLEYALLIETNQDIKNLNGNIARNEGYLKSLKNDEVI